MNWYTVRTIFRHGVTDEENGLFEEKAKIYLADSEQEAMSMAAADSAEYLAINTGFVQIPRFDVFCLGHDDTDLNGREVWSSMSTGPSNLDEYYAARYQHFDCCEE